jgi:hypothetical protein
LDKGYKKEKKFIKKKSCGQAHVGQKSNSNDESSESESDDFGNHRHQGQNFIKEVTLSKPLHAHMPHDKGGKKKVKSKVSSSPKYVTSDEDTFSSDSYASSDDDDPLSSEPVKKPNAMIKDLMKQVGARDKLLEQQEELLVQER